MPFVVGLGRFSFVYKGFPLGMASGGQPVMVKLFLNVFAVVAVVPVGSARLSPCAAGLDRVANRLAALVWDSSVFGGLPARSPEHF